MAVLLAYFSVVLIWATTPLAIQWSSHSLSFIAALLLRMAFALLLGALINVLLKRKLFAVSGAWKVYAAGAISIFPNMPVVYWSAQYIPSGLVAVVFAMSPFVTGLMSLLILKQNPFTPKRLLALAIAVGGLLTIFSHQFSLGAHAAFGIAGIFLSCFLFSLSSVLVKKVTVRVDAFNQMLGSILFAMPWLLMSWYLLDGNIQPVFSTKSFASVTYLAIGGSLLGGTLFFYVLANMTASAVSLITLLTPVLALILGAAVGHERLTAALWMGAGLVVIAILLYADFSANGLMRKLLTRGSRGGDELGDIKLR
jgi:drug/metabolite transporter (DMT)-like permease